jgi:methyltransferase family protein
MAARMVYRPFVALAATSLGPRLRYGGRLLWGLARNPVEGGARVRERISERRAGWRPETAYAVEQEWEARLHDLLDASWPCPDALAFAPRWQSIITSLDAQGFAIGRAAYGGWDDADPALARVAWCLARHLRPRQALETGVARGLTSRALLEALELNGDGRLTSVDLPPRFPPALRRQTGVAVPGRLRARWTYVNGSSRRRLPRLVAQLAPIDLFLHDSMHTTRNVLFELETVWPGLQPGGVILVDDIDLNRGFETFTDKHGPELRSLVGISDDRERRLGLLYKPRNG